jgi:hypothetical protein
MRRWITVLDRWEDAVTNQPSYPPWLNLLLGVTWAIAGAIFCLAFVAALLLMFVPGLASLAQPLAPVGEVAGAIVAGVMIVAMGLFLLFFLHVMLILFAYTGISLARSTLNSLLAVTGRSR